MKLTKSQKKRLYSIISGAVLFVLGFALKLLNIDLLSDIAFLSGGVAAGWLCVYKAFTGISRGDFFDENTLMTVAAAGAVAIGEYPECAAVMILYQVGELFQSIAVGKSRKAIRELSKLCPDTAHKVTNDGVEDIYAAELAVDDIIQIRAGERIPADSIILSGESAVDTSPVTGESVPRDVKAGDTVYSGCINETGLVECRVIHTPENSAAGRILKLTEEASDRKTVSETFIKRFARVYTPGVAILSIIIALGVPLALQIFNDIPFYKSVAQWSRRALSMLVISCPCSLVISVPLGYFCGLGNASKRGILIKGSAFVDALAQCDTAVFDKTGTLTEGKLRVNKVECEKEIGENELLSLAASAEKNSSHPIAKAICERAQNSFDVLSVHEISGVGVEAELSDGRKIKVCRPEIKRETTAVEIFVNGVFAGTVYLSDKVKETTKEALIKLKAQGINKTVMLTGDGYAAAKKVSEEIGINETHSELMPGDKYELIKKLCKEGKVMYAGDGINDSPSLAAADVGVSMGALGAQAAIEASDVVLMSGDLINLSYAKKLSKKTVGTVKANIVMSLGIKVAVLILAAFNLVGMWAAVAADVGVCILCVTNSVRLLKIK